MGYLEIRKGDSMSYFFKTNWRSEHYAHPKFIEMLCICGSFDKDTLIDAMSERNHRHYRTTTSSIDYPEFKKAIEGETYTLLVLSETSITRLITGIDVYIFGWDKILNKHYDMYVHRYKHTSRFYQQDSGYLCNQYPIDFL